MTPVQQFWLYFCVGAILYQQAMSVVCWYVRRRAHRRFNRGAR